MEFLYLFSLIIFVNDRFASSHLMSPLNSLEDYNDLAPAVVYKRVTAPIICMKSNILHNVFRVIFMVAVTSIWITATLLTCFKRNQRPIQFATIWNHYSGPDYEMNKKKFFCITDLLWGNNRPIKRSKRHSHKRFADESSEKTTKIQKRFKFR